MLYAPTKMLRATVAQEIRLVLAGDTGAPAGSYRRVQIVVPTEPRLFGDLDIDPQLIGLNRTYRMPQLAPGQLVRFRLLPNQQLFLAASEGFCEASLIVEHILRDDHA